jgi:transcriptional regulator with XRE-family HTH domain
MKYPLEGLDGMLRAFGREMAALRKRRGLSQAALAEATGLSLNTIGNVERGALDPTVSVVALMQVQLGSTGVELHQDRFVPMASPLPADARPFPNMEQPPATIVLTIGSVVRRRRLDVGMTIEELSGAAGVHANTIQNLEHGLVAPTISTLYRIYRALGVQRVVGTPSGLALE